jgi:uncharacterized membrane protein YccC
VHLWTVALLILLALAVGNLLRLGRQVNQVAISAVLVLALGTGYGSVRIIDTLLGAVVGVLVNALLAPPTHVRSAAVEIVRVAEDLGLLLADMGNGLRPASTRRRRGTGCTGPATWTRPGPGPATRSAGATRAWSTTRSPATRPRRWPG